MDVQCKYLLLEGSVFLLSNLYWKPLAALSRVERKVEERWRKQAGQAQRWDAAFRILHEELEGIKSQLHRYVQTVEDAERMSV